MLVWYCERLVCFCFVFLVIWVCVLFLLLFSCCGVAVWGNFLVGVVFFFWFFCFLVLCELIFSPVTSEQRWVQLTSVYIVVTSLCYYDDRSAGRYISLFYGVISSS